MSDAESFHMDALEFENLELWKLLCQTIPILRDAKFNDKKQQKKAYELYQKISNRVGEK